MTFAAQQRLSRIMAQHPRLMVMEIYPDGGVEFSIPLGGHWTHFAIYPDGEKAVLLG